MTYRYDPVHETCDNQSEGKIDHPDDPERDQLTRDELPFFDGRHVDLLDRADLLLLDDIQGSDKPCHHRYQDHEDARYHKELIVHRRIEPILRDDLYRWLR